MKIEVHVRLLVGCVAPCCTPAYCIWYITHSTFTAQSIASTEYNIYCTAFSTGGASATVVLKKKYILYIHNVHYYCMWYTMVHAVVQKMTKTENGWDLQPFGIRSHFKLDKQNFTGAGTNHRCHFFWIILLLLYILYNTVRTVPPGYCTVV